MTNFTRYRRNEAVLIEGVSHKVVARKDLGPFVAVMLQKEGASRPWYLPESRLWDLQLQGKLVRCPAPGTVH